MMKLSYKKGFTLIELLVVIAIIGIISSIVLVYLGNARDQAADSHVKSNLKSASSQVELFYSNSGSYFNGVSVVCPPTACNASSPPACLNAVFQQDSNVKGIITDAALSAGQPLSATRCAASNPLTLWAIAVPLKSNPSLFACIDGSGNSTTTPGIAGAPIGAAGQNAYRCQ